MHDLSWIIIAWDAINQLINCCNHIIAISISTLFKAYYSELKVNVWINVG